MPFALPPAANLVILPPQDGSGDERLGTFTAAGDVYIELSCKGKGELTIVGISSSGPCDGGNPVGIEVPGEEGKPVPLVVRAQPGTTWRLALGEHVPGAALVLVDRSGVGNRPLGTVQLHGTITVLTSCKGSGNFTVRFDPPSENTADVSTICPEGRATFRALPLRKTQTARMTVEAGPHARWTVRVSSTNAPR